MIAIKRFPLASYNSFLNGDSSGYTHNGTYLEMNRFMVIDAGSFIQRVD